MSRAHSLAGKMAGTTSAPVRSPYFTRSTAKLTRAKESLTEQETPGDFTPKKGSEERITQKLKTMKEQTLSNTTSGRKGKSRKSKSSVRSRSSTKRKVENKYKVSDTEEPQRMVTTPLDDQSGGEGGSFGISVKKSKKLRKAKYFTKKYSKLPRLGFKSTRRRHLSYSTFKPPQSPHGLIQEELYNNPWQLLIATIFLNRTTGVAAIPVLREFFKLFPTPSSVLTGDTQNTIAELMQPLGLNQKRADIIYKFSKDFVTKDWEYPQELFGIGKYGNDSYRIFCCGAEWLEVKPTDHMLNKYYDWLKEEYQSGNIVMDEAWYPRT